MPAPRPVAQPLHTRDLEIGPPPLRLQQRPALIVDEPECAARGREAQVRVVLAQQQSVLGAAGEHAIRLARADRKSTRLNSSHSQISYAVFCLKKKKDNKTDIQRCKCHSDLRE